MKRLRALFACILLTAAALTAGGCSDPAEKRTLVILGAWTDGEEKPFVEVLRSIGKRTGLTYVYKGTRSLRETLVAQLQAGAPPDMAILNSPGDAAEFALAGDAYPLPEKVSGAAVPPWAPTVTVENEQDEARTRAYWAPVRVDLKSLVWSRGKPAGQATSERPWCLGLGSGATSGWPGTDWIEDLLLQQMGDTEYERWATGGMEWKETAPAWRKWAELIADGKGDLGTEGLNSSFERLPDGRRGLLKSGRCDYEHQGSFIRRHYDDEVPPVLPTPTARFLGLKSAEADGAYEVSGDMAAVFRPSAAAWDLLGRLTSRQAREDWVKAAPAGERPFFPGTPVGGTPQSGSTLAVQKLIDGSRQICMDASDAMPPTLRDAFYRAVLEFLGAGDKEKVLPGLLDQLEAERKLQEKENAFVLDDLCDSPAAAP